MNEVMCLAEDNGISIFYQDTDSMHIPHDDISRLSELFEMKYNWKFIGKNMGQFHTEFSLKMIKMVNPVKTLQLMHVFLMGTSVTSIS